MDRKAKYETRAVRLRIEPLIKDGLEAGNP
jgi:hypothetical protein